MKFDDARWVRREKDQMALVLECEQEGGLYYMALRDDDHILLKSRIAEIEADRSSIEGELNSYVSACASLGEEVTRLRALKPPAEGDEVWQRKYYQLKVSSELAAMHEKQFLVSANNTIEAILNMITAHAIENTEYTASVLKKLHNEAMELAESKITP